MRPAWAQPKELKYLGFAQSRIEMIAEILKRALDCVQRLLIKWAMCKYKDFRRHRRRAEEWLKQVRKREPRMFAHWALSGNL